MDCTLLPSSLPVQPFLPQSSRFPPFTLVIARPKAVAIHPSVARPPPKNVIANEVKQSVRQRYTKPHRQFPLPLVRHCEAVATAAAICPSSVRPRPQDCFKSMAHLPDLTLVTNLQQALGLVIE